MAFVPDLHPPTCYWPFLFSYYMQRHILLFTFYYPSDVSPCGDCNVVDATFFGGGGAWGEEQ